MEQINLKEFANWLIFGGGSVLASSFILERFAWFQALASDMRKVVSYVIASSLGIGAYVLISYAPEFITAAQPYFLILAGSFVSIFLTNTFHASEKKRE